MKFISLRTGDEVHSVSFKTHSVLNIECNKRSVMSLAREKYFKLCSSIEKEMTSKVTQTMYMYTVLSKYM